MEKPWWKNKNFSYEKEFSKKASEHNYLEFFPLGLFDPETVEKSRKLESEKNCDVNGYVMYSNWKLSLKKL